jgi:hypothetical protein
MSAEIANVTMYTVAHGGVALAVGKLVEALFPAYDPRASDISLGVQLGGQFLLSVASCVQLLQFLQPEKAQPSIGDGVVFVALFGAQGEWRKKLELAYERMKSKFLHANGLSSHPSNADKISVGK